MDFLSLAEMGSTVFICILTLTVHRLLIAAGWIPAPVDRRLESSEKKLEYILSDRKQKWAEYQEHIDDLQGENDDLLERLKDVEHAINGDVLHVLGIWPAVGLDYQIEEDALYGANIDYLPLSGSSVNRYSIIEELRRHNYDCVEIGTHGHRDKGLQLSDGWEKQGWWQKVQERYNIRVWMLMACETDRIADSLIQAGAEYVVSTIDVIGEQAVKSFTQMFYSCLADKMSVEDAVRDAKMSLLREDERVIRLRSNKRSSL